MNQIWIRILVLAVSFVYVCQPKMALAESAPDLNKDLGFRSLNDPSIPSAIRSSVGSVIRIRVTLPYYERIIDLSQETSVSAKEAVLGRPLANNFDDLDKVVAITQISDCEVRKETKCRVSTFNERGTGFTTGDGSTVWTNFHVIDFATNSKGLSAPER